jgi:16S rRNA (guanine966-N2)-methyltransferase
MWQGSIAGCRWLDLCSGSGAMGAEALCREASLVIGIERSPAAGKIIEQNWGKVANDLQLFQLLQGDVVDRLQHLAGQKFDRIYFDPPYAAGLYQVVLGEIDLYQLLAPQGEIAVEHSPNSSISNLPDFLPSLELCRRKAYGNTELSFYQLKHEPAGG